MSRNININNFVECAKCHQNAEQDWNRFRDEYTTSYPIRDKDGQIYCWDCYKSKSHCEGCGKSVANIKFPRSGQPEYPHCNGGVSYGCERIDNDVKFICSKKCSEDIFNRKYQDWKDKLNQGWTKCKKCIKTTNQLIKWFEEIGTKNCEWLKEEKHQSRFIKLVPPGQGELCLVEQGCKWSKEVGKPRLKEVRVQAQKYWESLSYEARIKEVIRSRNAKQVAWGGKFENLTAEQIAAQNELPSGIRQEFELRNAHHGCSDCHLDKDFQNSTTGNVNISGSSSNENETKNTINSKLSDKETQLKIALEKGENSEKINNLKNDIKCLKDQARNSQQQKGENKNPLGNKHSGLIVGGIIMVFLFSLATILVVKGKKNKK